MRNHCVSNVLRCAALGVILLAAGAAFIAPVNADAPSVGGLLFGDNFTIQSPPSGSINTDITWSGRVSGPLAGVISYDLVNAVGTQTMDGSAFRMVDSVGNFPRVGLDYNFNGNVAAGGLKISYDIQCNAGSYDWGALYTGCDSATIPQFADGTNWNAWIMRSTHYWEYPAGTWNEQNWLYYGNNAGAGVYAAAGSTGVDFNDKLHHVDIVASDATDSRPFNGSGTIQLDYYVDGSYVTSYTDVDYFSNYIGLQAQTAVDPNSPFTYDNLQVYGNNLLVDTTVQWQGSTTNNWTDPASWTGAPLPNAQGAIARFLNPMATTVNVDADVIVGSICMMNNVGNFISGNKITLWANAGENSQIQVWDSYHTIASPIELKNDLDIGVGVWAYLGLTGTVSAPGGPVNVNVNGGGSYSGTVNISGNCNPGGAVTIHAGLVDVLPGGTLTASSISGNGGLYVEQAGGVDLSKVNYIGVLGLGSGVDCTVGTGQTLSVGSVTGANSGSGTLTLDGGTLQLWPAGTTQNLVDASLTQVTLTANGGTLDANGGDIWAIYAPIVGATPGTGILTIQDSTGLLSHTELYGAYSDYGGTNIRGTFNTVWAYPEALSGPIDVAQGNSLRMEPSSDNNYWTQPITLHGPPGGGSYQRASLVNEWGAAVAWVSDVTLKDDAAGGPTDPHSYSYLYTEGGTMVLYKITGDGNAVFGRLDAPGYNWLWTYLYGDETTNVANDYGTKSGDENVGVTVIKSGIVALYKLAGTIAIPTPEVYIGDPGDPDNCRWPILIQYFSDEINPQAVIKMYPAVGNDDHADKIRADLFFLAPQTIGGLESVEPTGTVAAVALSGANILTIDNAADHSFTGYFEGTGNLVKSGAGKQSLTLQSGDPYPWMLGSAGPYFTGTTTINEGTLAFSGSLMAGGLLTLSGNVSGAGTLEVFDDTVTPTVLTLSGTVDLGNAVIGATDTLVLAPAVASTADAIGQVTGDGDLQVGGTGTTLTSGRVSVRMLTVGAGNKVVIAPPSGGLAGAPAPVPEPSTLVLLALAGLAYAWYRLRK
jgi:hypothetical protein